ncbi:MAG: substrate-binding domain-containing protein [Bacteroidaceae bacterium]|nr:substrate-binding domain-containing protein [Bacteroidaceae bacterium]
MKKSSFSILAAATAVLALSLTACGGKKESKVGPNGELSGEISLSGAFALYPLAVQWANEFQKLHPDVKIDVSAGGAGKGVTDALAAVVDFGMVSRELSEAEIARGAVGFAVAKDAVVPTINADNPVLADLQKHGLTRDVLIDLWIKGKEKTWGEVAGTENKTPVVVYTRSDACGAAETWALYLGKKQEDLQGTAVYGDPGLAAAIQKDVSGLGLNNIGYAYDTKTGKPNPGILVAPIDVNGNGQIDPEEDFYDSKEKVVEAIADGRYPSPPARDLYFVSNGVPTDPVVIAFLKYILTDGQKENEGQGYIAIPQEKLDASLQKLGE